MSLSRHAVGVDGKTAYEIIRTRECNQPVARLGEKVRYMISRNKTNGQATSINTDWHEGVWAGVATRTGETIILTRQGAVRA